MSETDIIPYPILIGEVNKNKQERYVVAINEYKGRVYIDVRIHVKTDDKESFPTKKGITLSMNNFEPIAKLLIEAYKKLQEITASLPPPKPKKNSIKSTVEPDEIPD